MFQYFGHSLDALCCWRFYDRHSLSPFIIIQLSISGCVFNSILVILQQNYWPAYAMAMGGHAQIVMLCILGVLMEISVIICVIYRPFIPLVLVMVFLSHFFSSIKYNNIYEAISNFAWYRLPRNEWKTYQIVLHHFQQPRLILIAHIWPLNMETYVSVSPEQVCMEKLTWHSYF